MGRLERVGGGITALLGFFESAMIYVDAVDREVKSAFDFVFEGVCGRRCRRCQPASQPASGRARSQCRRILPKFVRSVDRLL